VSREEEEEVPPRKNRITKKKKGIITVGEDKDHAQSLTSVRPHMDPGRGRSARGPPAVPNGAVWVSAPQVCDRYGGVSHMWLERMLKRDPNFPRPRYFGRWRFFKIEELTAWERQAAVKSRAAHSGKAEARAEA
jgi:hypothetical protein